MLRFFFKLLIITSFMLTYTNASTSTKNKTIQDELTDIKIELSNIKLTQKYENRDNKIKEIEQSIKDLEVKVNKTVAKDIEKQDKRISDIGFYLTVSAIIVTFFGILITGIILFFTLKHSVIAKSQAREEVEKWVKEKADAEFKEKLDEYLEELENKGNNLLEQIKIQADKLNKKHKNDTEKILQDTKDKTEQMIKEHKARMNKEISSNEKSEDEINDVVEKLEKDESKYSFDDWYSKFLQKYYESNFEKALECINKALELSRNDAEESKALFRKALILGVLGKSEEAIAEYEKVIDRFSQSENERILEAVAKALVNKGITLGQLGKSEEAIAQFDKVIDRFSKSENEKLLEAVASALVNKIELMIISNQDILDDIESYKKLFSKDKNRMMKISMLEILNNAKKLDQDKALQEWKEIYKEQSLGDWGFDELDEWNESMTDENVKQRVKKYIDEFKYFKEK